MKDLVKKVGMQDVFTIASAATSTEELGSPVYPPARCKLREHGIDPAGKRSTQLCRADYEKYSWLIGMDTANLRNMLRILGGDPDHKMYRLLSFAGLERDIADPWYTGDFDQTWQDVQIGCRALFETILERQGSQAAKQALKR